MSSYIKYIIHILKCSVNREHISLYHIKELILGCISKTPSLVCPQIFRMGNFSSVNPFQEFSHFNNNILKNREKCFKCKPMYSIFKFFFPFAVLKTTTSLISLPSGDVLLKLDYFYPFQGCQIFIYFKFLWRPRFLLLGLECSPESRSSHHPTGSTSATCTPSRAQRTLLTSFIPEGVIARFQVF